MKETTRRLDLEDFLPYRLAVLAKHVSNTFSKTYGERFGLSISEWRVIAALGLYPNSSASIVSRYAALDKVQVSRALAGLIKRNLVNRTTDKLDRRNSILRLSKKGEEIYTQIVPVALQFEQELTDILSDKERLQLDNSLTKLMVHHDLL